MTSEIKEYIIVPIGSCPTKRVAIIIISYLGTNIGQICQTDARMPYVCINIQVVIYG